MKSHRTFLKRLFRLSGLVTCLIAAPAYSDRLAVVSRSDNLVAFIDLDTGAVTSTVATGNNPHEIVVDSDGLFAYVPSYGGNRIARINLQSEESVSLFDIHDHRAMHSAAWLQGSLWVTAEEKKALLKVDPESGEVVGEYPTGGDMSHMVTALPSQETLFVANMASGTVSVIAAQTGKQQLITSGAAPEGIDATPDGRRVWVSNRGDNTISVIDTETNEVQRQFSSQGKFPVKLRIRPDGQEVWVANNQSSSIAVFDAQTFQHKQNIDVGSRPLGITFSDDSSRAFVSRPGAAVVLEIDTTEYEILRSIEAPASPDGMAYLASD